MLAIFSAIAEFERAIIQERTRAGLDAACARGRGGGRPPALKPRDLKKARALLRDPEITVEEVAARLKVSPHALLPPARRARRGGRHDGRTGLIRRTLATTGLAASRYG